MGGWGRTGKRLKKLKRVLDKMNILERLEDKIKKTGTIMISGERHWENNDIK